MISSFAESITNWPNDRSIALGGPADAGAVVQIGLTELFQPSMVTDARGLARTVAASRAMRSNESDMPTRAVSACRPMTAVTAAGASWGIMPEGDETRGSTVAGAERTTLPGSPIFPASAKCIYRIRYPEQARSKPPRNSLAYECAGRRPIVGR